jgi:hypothetical protein
VRRLLQIVFFFEVGFVLAVVPWSAYWDNNYFVETVPWVRSVASNNFVRGAVTGLGLVNVLVGAVELVSIFIARREEEPMLSIGPSSIDD